ncbi:hypothetical protein COLO4_28900 [Corchorus olitorius]|uniref:FMR1-interacting protein 1 conserved domain-containing protein n=1 Tax=Corchorus olitorius TaxID=93759 RepID=A0A1R3HHK2_9ROSI|nr:hypothetical protein COLO4_28900 [Corchorus olitorius]
MTYTEQEIRQWREERKKYYPTKANIKKKLSGKVADSEVAKLRSEQLKDILAKQAQLGVEVAEIPSHYLLGSEKKVNGRGESNGPSTKRGRFEKHDKGGKSEKRDRFSRKRRSTNEESCEGPSSSKRSPTLLQKLLGADIRKDKSRLLQVFRFMVINSFFKDWPEKPLKYPVVVVRDGLCDSEIVQGNPLLVGNEDIEACNKSMIQSIGDGDIDHHKNKDGNAGNEDIEACNKSMIQSIGDGDIDHHKNNSGNDVDTVNEEKDDANGDEDNYDKHNQVALCLGDKADIGEEIVQNEEEEGEIID